mgnify:CR=1 FL=1
MIDCFCFDGWFSIDHPLQADCISRYRSYVVVVTALFFPPFSPNLLIAKPPFSPIEIFFRRFWIYRRRRRCRECAAADAIDVIDHGHGGAGFVHGRALHPALSIGHIIYRASVPASIFILIISITEQRRLDLKLKLVATSALPSSSSSSST